MIWLLCLLGCNVTRPPLTLDTADTAIVWEETGTSSRSLRDAAWALDLRELDELLPEEGR